MTYNNEVLRAHYHYDGPQSGHDVSDVYVTRINNSGNDSDAVGAATDHLAAQVLVVREGRRVGDELGLDELSDVLYRSDTYVANAGIEFHLSGVLGYCIIDGEAPEDVIAVKEGAVRSITAANAGLSARAYKRVASGLLLPVLEDYARQTNGVRDLSGMSIKLASHYPSSNAKRTMADFGMTLVEHVGFEGPANEVYAAMGGIGLNPPSAQK